MSLLGNQLLLQRILRKPTSSGGLTANSVDSSHIINGSITSADLNSSIVIDTLEATTNFSCGTFFSQLVDTTEIQTGLVNALEIDAKRVTFQNIPSGTDKVHGTATLVGGTVTVTHSVATANTKVLVTRNNVVNAANMGHLYVVKATGSFQIVSTNASDNNAVDWFFFRAT